MGYSNPAFNFSLGFMATTRYAGHNYGAMTGNMKEIYNNLYAMLNSPCSKVIDALTTEYFITPQ